MGKLFRVELAANGLYTELDLPATDYEMLDTLEKLNIAPGDPVSWEKIDEYWSIPKMGKGTLYDANAFAKALDGLRGMSRQALDGLILMEQAKGEYPVPIPRLVDLAYSTDCCLVADDITSDTLLGRHYAENGMVEGVEDLTDKVFEMLDFQKIGADIRRDEGGVFTPRAYVVRQDALKEVYKTLDLIPKKPDYIVLVELKRQAWTTPLKLPASPQDMDAALDKIGASTWSEVEFECLDCCVPPLMGTITQMVSIAHANRLAEHLARIPEQELPKYKALLAALDISEAHDAIELAGHLDEYILTPTIKDPEDIARQEITFSLGKTDAGALLPHVSLYQYGKALQEKRGMILTEYGSIERRDGQPVMERKGQEQPTMGGMEMA